MPTVIKATDRNAGVHSIAFNLRDLELNAESYLETVQEKARQILADAFGEAQKIHRLAEAEGRQAGEEALDAALNEKVAREMETVFPALRAAIGQINQSKEEWLRHWEARTVGLAIKIAERVVRREIAADSQITLNLVREALELASGSATVVVRMHPEDHAALRVQVEELVTQISSLGTVQVVADPTMTKGG